MNCKSKESDTLSYLLFGYMDFFSYLYRVVGREKVFKLFFREKVLSKCAVDPIYDTLSVGFFIKEFGKMKIILYLCFK